MVDVVIKTNAKEVADYFRNLNTKLNQSGLFLTNCGRLLVKLTKHRITTGGEGEWLPASKWTEAKKGTKQALQGTEKYVSYAVTGKGLNIYANLPGEWTFSQHERGFRNQLFKQSEMLGRKVQVKIVNPAPLNLRSPGVMQFVPKRAGVTPARRVWPNQAEVSRVLTPALRKFVESAVKAAGGVIRV